MRKVAIATVATGVAALGIATVAEAVGTVNQTYTGKITGKKGTKKKPHSVQFTTNITSGAQNPQENGTFATAKTVLFFDKNIKFNPKKFPTCTEAQANTAEASCAKALVGTGVANALAGAGGAVKSNNSVKYYNAPGNKLIIKLTSPAGAVPDATGTIVGTLGSASGKFGKKLTVPIPAKYQNQLGLTITLTTFTAKIKKTAKGRGYVESVGCPSSGKYAFKGVFTYSTFPTNGAPAPAVPPSQTVTSSSKC